MTTQLIRATAVYENGVLKPLGGPIPNLTEGDRVEVVLVRVAPLADAAPEEVARRERIAKEFRERMEQLDALPPDPDQLSYEEGCRAFDEGRGASRKLFPPEMKGITW